MGNQRNHHILDLSGHEDVVVERILKCAIFHPRQDLTLSNSEDKRGTCQIRANRSPVYSMSYNRAENAVLLCTLCYL